VSEGVKENWWRQGMMGSIKAHYDCIKAFSETDFTDDLKKIDIPVLVMHGDDDQIVPIPTLPAIGQASEQGHAQGLSGPGARHVHDPSGGSSNSDLLAFFSPDLQRGEWNGHAQGRYGSPWRCG